MMRGEQRPKEVTELDVCDKSQDLLVLWARGLAFLFFLSGMVEEKENLNIDG